MNGAVRRQEDRRRTVNKKTERSTSSGLGDPSDMFCGGIHIEISTLTRFAKDKLRYQQRGRLRREKEIGRIRLHMQGLRDLRFSGCIAAYLVCVLLSQSDPANAAHTKKIIVSGGGFQPT